MTDQHMKMPILKTDDTGFKVDCENCGPSPAQEFVYERTERCTYRLHANQGRLFTGPEPTRRVLIDTTYSPAVYHETCGWYADPSEITGPAA